MTKIKILFLLPSLLVHLGFSAEILLTDVEAKYTNYDEIKATETLEQSVHVGFSNTTGNTQTLNLNGKYKLSSTLKGYGKNPLKVAFDLAAFFTENNGVKSNEEYLSNLGLEQSMNESWLLYTGVNWLRNPEFRNYNNKLAVNMGVGKELYHKGKHLLVAKMGTAYNLEDYSNQQASEHFSSLNEYVEYKNKLNALSHLYCEIGSMQNFNNFNEDYEVLGVLGLSFEVAKKLNLTIEEEVAYDNLPAVGFKKSDTKSIVRLGYVF